MNSRKDYKDRLPTEEDVKKSLDRYFGFMHAKINALGDFNLSKITTMQDKGWYMKSSKEEMEQLINDFVNIYGYIYKEGETEYRGRLIRGTTTDELRQMENGKEIATILSTTTDENIAKRFCEYGKAALIRIGTSKNLPYVYVEHLKDENLEEEDEVLILPFSKVRSSEFTSDWNGYKYYDVTLEKAELPEISDERLEELREKCIEGYEEFENQIKEYKEFSYSYERIMQMSLDDEEKRIASEKKESLIENIHNYKSQFQEMLKGMCRQREKDIDLQKEAEEKAIKEERKRQEELRLKRLEEGIEQFKESISNDTAIIQQNAEGNVSDLFKTINKYRNISNTLGIETFNSQNLEYDIQARLGYITDGLKEEVVEQNPNIEYGKLEDRLQNYEGAKDLLQEMPELLKSYDENSMADLKTNLNQKVQGIIYKTTFNRLNTEKQTALLQKDTFLNKLLGKTALKEAQIKNIEAKMEYARRKAEVSKTNRVREMLSEMYECAYKFNGGNLTPEMIEIEENIRKVFSNLPAKTSFEEQALSNQASELPVIVPKTKPFNWLRNGQEVKRLNNETLGINEEIENINVPVKQVINQNSNLTSIYSQYNSILEEVRGLVSIKDKQREVRLEKETEQWIN